MAVDTQDAYGSVTTLDRLYHLQTGHSLKAPISELEMRATRVHCPNGAYWYTWTTMSRTLFTVATSTASTASGLFLYHLTVGQRIPLPASDSCSNEAIFIGKPLL
jgi:hypothetical protein